jgi:hypothetical protein
MVPRHTVIDERRSAACSRTDENGDQEHADDEAEAVSVRRSGMIAYKGLERTGVNSDGNASQRLD